MTQTHTKDDGWAIKIKKKTSLDELKAERELSRPEPLVVNLDGFKVRRREEEVSKTTSRSGSCDEWGESATTSTETLEEVRTSFEEMELEARRNLGSYRKQLTPRKPGPIDIGWAEDFVAAEFETDHLFYDATEPKVPKSPPITEHVHKRGPVETGIMEGYRYETYDTEDSFFDLLSPRYPTLREKEVPGGVERQRSTGPRDEEPPLDGWKAAKYDLSERTYEEERVESPRKRGPREIGRNRDFHSPEYDLPESYGLDEYKPMYKHKPIRPEDHPINQGPVEIGRNSDFKPARFEPQRVWELDQYIPEHPAKPYTSEDLPPHKEGPVQIGRLSPKEFKPYRYEGSPVRTHRLKRRHSTPSSERGDTADREKRGPETKMERRRHSLFGPNTSRIPGNPNVLRLSGLNNFLVTTSEW